MTISYSYNKSCKIVGSYNTSIYRYLHHDIYLNFLYGTYKQLYVAKYVIYTYLVYALILLIILGGIIVYQSKQPHLGVEQTGASSS